MPTARATAQSGEQAAEKDVTTTSEAPTPPPSDGPPPRAVQRVCALAGATATIAAVVTVLLPRHMLTPSQLFGALAITVLVAITERWSLTIRIGNESHHWTFSELPLVIGLFTLNPLALVGARVLGALVALRVLRSQPGYKAAYNIASLWLETALVVAVVHALGADSVTDGIMGTAAILAVALTVTLIGAAAMTGAMSAMEGHFISGLLPQVFRDQIGPITATAAAASIGMALAQTAPMLLWAPMVILGVLAMAYHSHLGLIASQDIHNHLLSFTKDVTGEDDVEGTARQIALAAQALVDAPHAALRIRVGAEAQPRWIGTTEHLAPEIDHAFSLREGTHVERDGCCTNLRPAVVLVPLEAIEAGWLAVGFEQDRRVSRLERHAVELMANHAAIALANANRGTALRDQADEARHRARHDSLTGLPNRISLHEVIEEQVEQGQPFALLMMDLNDFKEINDALGHAAGDSVLAEVANRLSTVADEALLLARLGGDEFAAVISGGENGAREFAERLAGQVSRPVSAGTYTIEVSSSVGIALFPTHGSDVEELMKNADLAMYEAKGEGGGTSVFGAAAGGRAVRQLAVSSGFRTALQSGALSVAFQPVIELSTERLVGVEALARWTHPELGPVRPDEFVRVAEQAGLITELTHQVLDESLAWQRRWAADGLDLRVSVNLSARSLRDTELPKRIARQLDQHGVPADRLTLELTEGSIVSDPHRTLPVLARLAGLGVKLSIDDFGTGYSSLAYLRQLPAHEVKIDKSFVLPLDTDPDAAPLVAGIVRLCHELGYAVVAEGIESAAVLQTLAGMDCERGQGFHIARPMHAEDLQGWDARRHRPATLRLLGS